VPNSQDRVRNHVSTEATRTAVSLAHSSTYENLKQASTGSRHNWQLAGMRQYLEHFNIFSLIFTLLTLSVGFSISTMLRSHHHRPPPELFYLPNLHLSHKTRIPQPRPSTGTHHSAFCLSEFDGSGDLIQLESLWMSLFLVPQCPQGSPRCSVQDAACRAPLLCKAEWRFTI
jgi:hypothetical protein